MKRQHMKRNLVAIGASAALLSFGGAAALANGSHGAPSVNTATQSASNTQILPISLGLGAAAPVNANVPVGALSAGSNGGDVEQRSDATAEGQSKNNETVQTVRQRTGDGGGTNTATQSSTSTQVIPVAIGAGVAAPINANVPVAALSADSNNGDVKQRNDAKVRGEGLNNETEQTIRQEGTRKGSENSAKQSAANTQVLAAALGPALSIPLNPNVPVALLAADVNDGDVNQFADGDVFVESINNDTNQEALQSDSQQLVSAMLSNVADAMAEASAAQDMLGGL